MSDIAYYAVCGVLVPGVLLGITMMSRVETAAKGNGLSAICIAAAITLTLHKHQILSDAALWICIAIGLSAGLYGAYRVKMIDMPQAVAVFNGFGGASSALVAIVSMTENRGMNVFELTTAVLAIEVGVVTLIGSLVAAGKLHRILPQRPVIWRGHKAISIISLLFCAAAVIAIPVANTGGAALIILILACAIFSGLFGAAFSIRVGGADMPITISLLVSLSGVAGAITGMAVNDPLLVAIGGIVGASGLLLTQIMCRDMNRSLADILIGTSGAGEHIPQVDVALKPAEECAEPLEDPVQNLSMILASAEKVIIVPGYGMAVAQAQTLVKQLADKLSSKGTKVSYAVHPVAGRMPGHMNVLLCEADIPYEDLCEMDEINPQFVECDIAIVVGANDVINPAANTAENTPIYGMPILDVEKAKNIIICNFDLSPGYSGVPNPLYARESGVILMLGDAKDSLNKVLACIS